MRADSEACDRDALSDIIGSRVLDQIARVPGVGSTQQFGSEYAMNIWLNPDQLRGYGLSATQVLTAVRGQNVQFAAGKIGADPAPAEQGSPRRCRPKGRFSTPEQFGNIILRTNSDGTTVRLRDVARIGWARRPTASTAAGTASRPPVSPCSSRPAPTRWAWRRRSMIAWTELQATFPQGVTWFSPYDSSTFVAVSIKEVIKTLGEAIVLVFLVMLIFLQNFRATLIPTLVIPIALLGTFLGMYLIGFTINQLSLFGMVLAIGIVVDDAIVVIENVERIMTEEGLSPKAATRKSMGQISGAVVAITVVLAAVFIPSAFQGGSAGEIYKQFAITIAMAMGFSAFLALGFTPALCATLLKPTRAPPRQLRLPQLQQALRQGRQHLYRPHRQRDQARAALDDRVRRCWWCCAASCSLRMPGSFLPEEDQGYAIALIVQLPPGATIERTKRVFDQVRETCEKQEGFDGMLQVVRLQLRRPRRKRRHRPSSAQALGRTQGHRDRIHPEGQHGAVRHPRRADLRDQPADRERPGRSSAASTCTCRIVGGQGREALGRGAQPVARQGQPESRR